MSEPFHKHRDLQLKQFWEKSWFCCLWIFCSCHSKRTAAAHIKAKKSNVTLYDYRHFTFCMSLLKKGNGSILAACCNSYLHTSKRLGFNSTSLTDYRNGRTCWFSFEKKRQLQLTAKKFKDKYTAQIWGAATLSLTDSDFGSSTATWWPHEICIKQRRSWLPSQRAGNLGKMPPPPLVCINTACWYWVKQGLPTLQKFLLSVFSLLF